MHWLSTDARPVVVQGLAIGGGSNRAPAMLRLGNLDATHPAALQAHVDFVARNAGRHGRGWSENGRQGVAEQALLDALLTVVQQISALRESTEPGVWCVIRQSDALCCPPLLLQLPSVLRNLTLLAALLESNESNGLDLRRL
jgi:hypothetical protein